MCNACGFLCCGSDQFGGCGCDHCACEDCWSDEPDDDGDEADYFDIVETEEAIAEPGERITLDQLKAAVAVKH